MQALRALRAKDDNALVALVAQPGVQAALDGARAGGREGGREAEVCAIARRAAAIARQVTAQQQQRMRNLAGGGGGGGGGGGISDGARLGSIATQDGRATPPVGGEVPGEVHPLLLLCPAPTIHKKKKRKKTNLKPTYNKALNTAGGCH